MVPRTNNEVAGRGRADTPHELLMTAADVAQQLAVSKSHVYRLLSAGRLIKPIRLGGAVRWRRDALLAWIEAGMPKQS